MDIRNAGEYIESFLRIKTKDSRIIPLELNEPQKKLYRVIEGQTAENKPVRVIILKARQMGFSTLTEALIFHSSATRFNVNSLIVAHRDDSTVNLFNMSKLFFDELPHPLKPMVKNSNAYELRFENPTRDPAEKKSRPGLRSRIRCVTAGGKGIGRSDTLTNVHISEYAFWEGDKKLTLSGLMQAVPAIPGTMVIIESTANGYDDFQKMWSAAVKGESDFIPVFFGWHEMPDYRMPVPPGTKWTGDELGLKKQYGLDDEQLAWRRWCIKNNCGNDERLFKQEYPSSPDEAFLTSGDGVFNNEAIIKLREKVPKPKKTGEFTYKYDGKRITRIKFSPKENGCISIYENPKKKYPYVIGGDTAGEGSNLFAGQVLDNTSGKQVAVMHHKYDEPYYARQMYCLGMHYNKALIGIETNFSTYPVRELVRLGYPKQYVRQAEDTYTHKLKESFGFKTTRVTRPLIIAGLVDIMNETPELVRDYNTLGELLTFVKNEHGRPEAMEGENDDLVMALAIAHYIRTQQVYTIPEKEEPKAEWTRDMWEDYAGASTEEKAYLVEKWGKPK